MCQAMKPDPANPASLTKALKVLDLSYNPITDKSINEIADMLNVNRNLEYLGLAKCNLQAAQASKVFEQIGKIPFPQDQVDAYQVKIKARDAILEKNKKQKAAKKPEDPVPAMDMIEQSSYTNSEGNEIQGWVLLKNVQFKHINMCSNDINDESKEAITALIRRTNDDFGITIAGNPITKAIVDSFWKTAQTMHQTRVPADQVDVQMGIRRIAF